MLNEGKSTHSALEATTRFEALLGMLQCDICVVVGPDHTVDVTGDRNEERRVGELLDRPLDDLTNLYIRNLQELLS